MRSAPIGLGYGSAVDAFDLARESASETHGHPSGYLSAAYFAALIQRVTHGDTLPEAMRCADELLVKQRGHEEVAAAVAAARTLATSGPPGPDALETLGQGWVGEEALAIALACTLTAEDSSPEAVSGALWRSVLHGGDSDSTGSLAGNLLGAMHGMDCLPTRWLAQLELCDVIERVAQDLFRSTHLNEALDVDEYPTH
jgi:ADP-ribosylglycohydrolase